VVQADQALTAQSTGHGCVLHERVSDVAGHAAPPKAAAVVTERERDCEPPPHVRVHFEKSDHDVTTQSTAQLWVLHACDWIKVGHMLPPFCGAVTTERVCVCEPLPHDLLHVVHVDQAETSQ